MLSFRRCFCRPAVAIFVLTMLWPSFVLGQDKAGVVTTLEGNVTATAPRLTQPVTLKFKDDVYTNDRITTGDRSLARMLLGGKAVVTVRERSVITITETTNKSTIDLVSGKIGLAVSKERMRPGEQIEVKTPNAVAAVRGTVIVAEVERATAQVGGPGPAVVTHFWVLRGAIEAWQLVPGTNTLAGNSFQVNTLQGFTAAGGAPPTVGNIPPGQLGQITGGLTPQGQKPGGDQGQVVTQQMQAAGALLSGLNPPPPIINTIILPPINSLCGAGPCNIAPPPLPPRRDLNR